MFTTEKQAQELCESRGGRPGLPSLISRTVSVDVKQHSAKSYCALIDRGFVFNVATMNKTSL